MIDEERLKEIGPYEDSEFQQKMAVLVREPGFLHALSYTMPSEEIPALMDELLKIKNKYDFQHQIMFPFMEMRPRLLLQVSHSEVPSTTIRP